MIKLPKRLKKENLIEALSENYGTTEPEGEWGRGYDACIEMIAQEFLTDKELNKLFGFQNNEVKE